MIDIFAASLAATGGILSAIAMYYMGRKNGRFQGRISLYLDLDKLTDEKIVMMVREISELIREKGIVNEEAD